MKRRILALLLAAGILTGCGKQVSPNLTEPAPEVTVPVEEQIDYDWMAGQSPVPNRRVGLDRGWSMNTKTQTVSDRGTYFIYSPEWMVDVTPPSPWILYKDHKSDTMIKLCGRPDCPHNTTDCNAYVPEAQSIHFYNGYLYVISSGPVMTGNNEGTAKFYWSCRLLRMDPDGTNRVELFNFTDYVRQKGANFAEARFVEGYCTVDTHEYTENADDSLDEDTGGVYLYKLDGSMEEPMEITFELSPLYNCGDRLLVIDSENKSYWDLDIETMEKTFLMDFPGQASFCYEEQAFYFLEGNLHRVTYESGADEVVLETELEGNYLPLCFPDCFVLVDRDYAREEPDRNLYIYNWAFEPVGTVTLDFHFGGPAENLVISENPRQIILSGGDTTVLPSYYIDKGELGTENVQLHPLKMPDLEDAQQLQQEAQEDAAWFEEN